MHSWGRFDGQIFTKADLMHAWKVSSNTANARIKQAYKSRELLKLKNGLYMTTAYYLNEKNKSKLAELSSSKLYSPSYLSLEFVLKKYNLLSKDTSMSGDTSITCISTKPNRSFSNFIGSFNYSRIKKSFHFGLEEISFNGYTYHAATKAKALFDYLYLKPDLNYRNFKKLKKQFFSELKIQWANFSEEDLQQFDQYVWKSNSAKMMTILRAIEDYFSDKKFDRWAKELLNS